MTRMNNPSLYKEMLTSHHDYWRRAPRLVTPPVPIFGFLDYHAVTIRATVQVRICVHACMYLYVCHPHFVSSTYRYTHTHKYKHKHKHTHVHHTNIYLRIHARIQTNTNQDRRERGKVRERERERGVKKPVHYFDTAFFLLSFWVDPANQRACILLLIFAFWYMHTNTYIHTHMPINLNLNTSQFQRMR